MGICDSCMREDSEEIEKRRTSDSFDLKKGANENGGRQTLLVKEVNCNQKPSMPPKQTVDARFEPGVKTVNKEDTELELEGSKVKSVAATNIARNGLSEKQPPVKLGSGQSAAPAYSVKNQPPDSGLVKMNIKSARGEWGRGHAGRGTRHVSRFNPHGGDTHSTTKNHKGHRSTNTQAKAQNVDKYYPGTIQDSYFIGKVLGAGSTSTCYTCKEKATGQTYACKLMSKKFLQENYSGLLSQFMAEIDVLKFLKHPNIIFLKDVYSTPTSIYMVMELVKGGEMFDYIVQRGRLSEGEASGLIRQVASGLAYMHSMAVIHRDLKPENLLLTKQDIRAEVKIIDFGLAKMLHPGNGYTTTNFLGTKGYLAPEMLRRCGYGFKVDTWALGIIMFVLLFGCLPFDDDLSPINEAKAMSKFVLRFPRMGHKLSNDAKDLLRGLLDVSPSARLSAADALNYAWLGADIKAKNNMLESPKRLKEMEKIGTPGQSYGQGRNAVTVQRKLDFETQKREFMQSAMVS